VPEESSLPVLFINEDLAKETMEKREDYRPKMDEAKHHHHHHHYLLN